ncbi:MAG: hypothetical protein APF77_16520 [Clostridia bacterium BRH_c25]|nr:MAG: hypothetical protein APF77_16520 [Clostridia bacterium BRH_c25]
MGYSIFDETMVDMAWPQIEEAVKEGAIALFPTGVIEAHGPHMGLGVDAYGSYIKCKLTRRCLEAKGIRTLVVPPYYWGINNALGSFYGSFSVRKDTMKNLLCDIFSSLKRWGITDVFNINHHGDPEHNSAIFEAIESSREKIGINAYSILSVDEVKRFGFTGREDFIIVMEDIEENAGDSGYIDIHAGAEETSMMHEYFPGAVDAELAKSLKPTNLSGDDLTEWRKGWEISRKVTPLGYVGNPAGYMAVNGNLEKFAEIVACLIEKRVK